MTPTLIYAICVRAFCVFFFFSNPPAFAATRVDITPVSVTCPNTSVTPVIQQPLGDFVQQTQMSRSARSAPSEGPHKPFTVKTTCMLNQVRVSANTQATSSQELALGAPCSGQLEN